MPIIAITTSSSTKVNAVRSPQTDRRPNFLMVYPQPYVRRVTLYQLCINCPSFATTRAIAWWRNARAIPTQSKSPFPTRSRTCIAATSTTSQMCNCTPASAVKRAASPYRNFPLAHKVIVALGVDLRNKIMGVRKIAARKARLRQPAPIARPTIHDEFQVPRRALIPAVFWK